MQRVMTEDRRITKHRHLEEERHHLKEVESLQSAMEELRSNTQRIGVLEEEMRRIRVEHLRDKQQFAINTAEELNRLRSQLRTMGRAQQIQIENRHRHHHQTQNSYFSAVS